MVGLPGQKSSRMGPRSRRPEAQGDAGRDGQGGRRAQGQGGREVGEVQDQPVQSHRLGDALAQSEFAGCQAQRVSL